MMMTLADNDWLAIVLSLKLALSASVILLIIGLPLAWWLSRTQFAAKVVVEAVIALPLVLPPTVLGFYLLMAMGPQGLASLGLPNLAFSFSGLVIASVIYSLPFVVQPIHGAFNAIPNRTLEAAATLGASPMTIFFRLAIPASLRGILSGIALGFAHTLGEFGVVLMIGGNMPGQTQVLSIAIYDHVEALEYSSAHSLSLGLVIFSLLLLTFLYAINRRHQVSVYGA